MVWLNSLKANCWLLCLIASLVLAISEETAANWHRDRAGRLITGRDSWRESQIEAPMIDYQEQEEEQEDYNEFDDDRFASRLAKPTKEEFDANIAKLEKEAHEKGYDRLCSNNIVMPAASAIGPLNKIVNKITGLETRVPNCSPLGPAGFL